MPPALIVLNMTLNCFRPCLSLTSLLINIMAIRKAIASGLYSAAAAVQRDQTKEKLQATVSGARVVLAEWIRPKPNR
jgi:hypothetical protein